MEEKMPSEEKLTLKDGLKIVAIILCTIGALLGLLISVLGFVVWIISGFSLTYLFGSLFFFFVVVLPCSYVVTRYKPVWEKFEVRIGYVPTPPREQLKTFIFYVTILFVFFLMFNYFSGFIPSSPESIGIELAKDILRNLVQVNGILMGLCGIVYVQLLRMNFSKTKVVNAIFIVTSMLVASMLSSLSVMASTYNKIEIDWIEVRNYPINFLIFGIVSFLISLFVIISSKTETEEET